MSNTAEQLDTPVRTLGELASERHALRDEKRKLNEQLKEVDAQLKDNELELLEALDAAGVEATKAAGISLSISEQVVPSVTDWDAFYGYIKANDAMYMLERRAASAAFREAHQAGLDVPGVEPFTKRSINMRKA